MDEFDNVKLPDFPKTVLNFTRIDGGKSFNRIAEAAVIQGESLSDDAAVCENITKELEDIVKSIVADKGYGLSFAIISRRPRGGIPNYHFLVQLAVSTKHVL